MSETINNKLFRIKDLESIVILDDCDDDFINDVSKLNIAIPKDELDKILNYIKALINSIEAIDTCESLTIALSNELVDEINNYSHFEDIDIVKEDFKVDDASVSFNLNDSVTSISFQITFRDVSIYAEFEIETVQKFED